MGRTGRFWALLPLCALAGAGSISPVFAQTDAKAVNDLYRKAGMAEQAGKADDALAAYSGIIKLRPDDEDAWRDRADTELAGNHEDAAIGDFSHAIGLKANDARAFVGRAQAQLDKSGFAAALADFDTALRLNPEYADAVAGKAAVYDQQRNYPAAIAAFDALVKLQPDNGQAYNGRCWERAMAGQDLKAAEGDCAAALKRASGRRMVAQLRDSRGFVYFRQGRFADAIAEYNATLAVTPRSADTLYRRGLAKARTGDAAGAKSDIAAALKIDSHAGDEMSGIGLKP